MSAAKNDFEEVAEALLNHRNTDPNNEMHPGFTALGIAIQHDNEDIVELLLDHRDIDPNLGYPNGRTPLHIAAFDNNYDITEMLLDHRDTDPNTRDIYNQTVMNIARYYGYDRLAELWKNTVVIFDADRLEYEIWNFVSCQLMTFDQFPVPRPLHAGRAVRARLR